MHGSLDRQVAGGVHNDRLARVTLRRSWLESPSVYTLPDVVDVREMREQERVKLMVAHNDMTLGDLRPPPHAYDGLLIVLTLRLHVIRVAARL